MLPRYQMPSPSLLMCKIKEVTHILIQHLLEVIGILRYLNMIVSGFVNGVRCFQYIISLNLVAVVVIIHLTMVLITLVNLYNKCKITCDNYGFTIAGEFDKVMSTGSKYGISAITNTISTFPSGLNDGLCAFQHQ